MNMISEAADKCGNNMTANAEYIRENLFDGEWEIMIFNPSTTFGGWVSQKMIGTGFFFAYLGSFGPYNWLYALYIPDYGTFKELR